MPLTVGPVPTHAPFVAQRALHNKWPLCAFAAIQPDGRSHSRKEALSWPMVSNQSGYDEIIMMMVVVMMMMMMMMMMTRMMMMMMMMMMITTFVQPRLVQEQPTGTAAHRREITSHPQ